MARSAVLTTAKRIRRRSRSTHRVEISVLNTAITDSDTTITFQTTMPNSVIVGAELELDAEIVRVTAVDQNANTATVLRGWNDSIATAHDQYTVVHINPRFSLHDIIELMRSELLSWSDLYRLADDTFTVDAGAITYELPVAWSSMLRPLRVLQKSGSGSVISWPVLEHKLINGTAAGFDGATTSGKLLRFLQPLLEGEIYVRVALPFADFALDDDLVTDVGLADGMLEVLELGTLLKLIGDDLQAASARNAQDEARRAEETPVGSMVPANQWMFAQYMRRRTEEANKLLAQDGISW